MTGKKQLADELEAMRRQITELEEERDRDAGAGKRTPIGVPVIAAAIEEMPDGVMLVDEEGQVVYVNKAFERMFGYTPEELVGTSALDLPTHGGASDREKAGQAMEEVLGKGSTEHVDIGAVTKSGKEVSVSFAASVVGGGGGGRKTLIAVIRDVTERKRAEDELREREENFRVLVENSLDMSIIINGDLTIRYASPSVKRSVGHDVNELVGKVALDFLHPDDARDVTKILESVASRPGEVASVEVRFRHKDGSWRVLEGVANSLLDDPTVNGIVVNARDVTERKKTEAAVREREEYFRALIENSLDGIAILNEDLTIGYESPSAERILGYEPEEMVGRGALEFVHPDDARVANDGFKALAKKPALAVPATVRLLHKDGSWRVIEGIAHNLLRDPVVRGIIVNYRDVTERKQAEEALRQREEQFRIFIENSLDDVSILDSEGHIVYQSPSIERVLGYEPGEQVGKDSLSFVHPEDLPLVTEAFAELSGNPGAVYQGELRAQHRDGSWRTLEVMVRNFVDDPVVRGIVANFRDVTERKMAEQERVEHAAALARAEELQLSRQRLVTVQESVRRDIAQEIHGSVQNRLIILLHRLAELERSTAAGEVASELADLRQKLGDLLDGTVRSISHRLYPSILRRGLVPALQSLGDQFEAAMAIEMELDESLVRQERANPRVIMEQVRLAAYRIAEEAMTNAVKHAKATKATIRLQLGSDERLRLTVRNDGQGFDAGEAARGLGILMMQDYAEVVGGDCVVDSAPDRGTAVSATLPLAGPGAERPERASPLE
jgi:PAS domain S-box-containing protein